MQLPLLRPPRLVASYICTIYICIYVHIWYIYIVRLVSACGVCSGNYSIYMTVWTNGEYLKAFNCPSFRHNSDLSLRLPQQWLGNSLSRDGSTWAEKEGQVCCTPVARGQRWSPRLAGHVPHH